MPITLEWMDEEKTIIYARIFGTTEHEEFVAVEREGRAMLESVSHPVDIIYDSRAQFVFTPRMLETAYHMNRKPFPNLRILVFVGRNLAWDLFIAFANRFGRIPYTFVGVNDKEEALAVIKRLRQEEAVTGRASASLN